MHVKNIRCENLNLFTVYTFQFPDLTTVIKEAYTPSPQVTTITDVFDIKSWIAPHLNEIHGHTTPLCFKFVLVNEMATMFYRHWSTDPWCDKGVILLKVKDFKNIKYRANTFKIVQDICIMLT
jgi:hypothetical protein